MRDHQAECTITIDGHCTCATTYWRSEMKALHEELRGTRFAMWFMFAMWVITLGVLILWTK